ncbi:MAG: hypothetical protein WKF97_19615 [Chitinophagaceae bacterium]
MLLAISVSLSFAQQNTNVVGVLVVDLPSGWNKSGGNPDKYEMGIGKSMGHNSENAATIKSKEYKSMALVV